MGSMSLKHQLELRGTKERGHVAKLYLMTLDLHLRRALMAAVELRRANRGGAASLPSDYFFITKQGKPYSKESFKRLWANVREKLDLGPREITFHDREQRRLWTAARTVKRRTCYTTKTSR